MYTYYTWKLKGSMTIIPLEILFLIIDVFWWIDDESIILSAYLLITIFVITIFKTWFIETRKSYQPNFFNHWIRNLT